jgi:hypothetical protein
MSDDCDDNWPPHPMFGAIIRATFQPKNRATLRPEALEHIGHTFTFQYAWLITEADGPEYAGQAAWSPIPARGQPSALRGWVPDEDLTDIVDITGTLDDYRHRRPDFNAPSRFIPHGTAKQATYTLMHTFYSTILAPIEVLPRTINPTIDPFTRTSITTALAECAPVAPTGLFIPSHPISKD